MTGAEKQLLRDYAAELEFALAGGGTLFAPRNAAQFAALLRRLSGEPMPYVVVRGIGGFEYERRFACVADAERYADEKVVEGYDARVEWEHRPTEARSAEVQK